MKRSEIEQILENSSFFKGIAKENLKEVADLCDVKTFEAGGYVFHQGDNGDHLYIISDGQVFLERSRDLGGRSGSVVISALGKGRLLGCWSTLLGEPHRLMCSATCRKPTTVISFKGSDLRKIMVENSNIGFYILERLSFLLRDRIQSAYDALEKL